MNMNRDDHFHDNGVPKWKGTGYFYSRYRPGFKSVVAILIVFYIFLHGIRLQKVKALNDMKEQAISFATGGKAAVVGRNREFDEKKLALQTAAGPGLKELGLDESPYPKSQKLEVVIIGPEVYVVKDGKRESSFSHSQLHPSQSQIISASQN